MEPSPRRDAADLMTAAADPNAKVTLAEVESALARALAPLKSEIAGLQRQIDILRLGPAPW